MKEFVSAFNYFTLIEVAVAPVSVHLSTVRQMLAPHIIVAAQNSAAQGNGAFTGEVSADILADLGI